MSLSNFILPLTFPLPRPLLLITKNLFALTRFCCWVCRKLKGLLGLDCLWELCSGVVILWWGSDAVGERYTGELCSGVVILGERYIGE